MRVSCTESTFCFTVSRIVIKQLHIPCLLVPTSVSFHDEARLIFFSECVSFSWFFVHWIILDCILDIINVQLWVLWILSFPTDEWCFLYFSGSFSWLGLDCRLCCICVTSYSVRVFCLWVGCFESALYLCVSGVRQGGEYSEFAGPPSSSLSGAAPLLASPRCMVYQHFFSSLVPQARKIVGFLCLLLPLCMLHGLHLASV